MNQRVTELRELADRFDRGAADDQELIDAFASMPYDLIEKVEAALQRGVVSGMPHLPKSLNPGRPEFHSAMARLKAIHDHEETTDRQEIMRLNIEMMRLAPPWWKAEIDKIFNEYFDLSPDAYSEDDQPLFSAKNIATSLGVSEGEIIEQIQSLSADGHQLASNSGCFRVQ